MCASDRMDEMDEMDEMDGMDRMDRMDEMDICSGGFGDSPLRSLLGEDGGQTPPVASLLLGV